MAQILDFPGWMTSEITNRGWSQAEFSRRAGLSNAQVSRVLAREYRPGPDFCQGTATAFNMPVAKVFRMAGLLPSYPVANLRDEFFEMFDSLDDESQQELFRLARMMRVCADLEAASLDDP